jgi:hypothetical protein
MALSQILARLLREFLENFLSPPRGLSGHPTGYIAERTA